MPGFISYIVDNDKKFQAAIADAYKRTGDLRVPFGLILQDFYRSEKALFQLQGPGQYPPFKNSHGHYVTRKNGSRKWVQDEGGESPYQRAKKRKVGFDYPLLVRSGRLAASLLSASSSDAIAVATPSTLTIGTRVPYGIYHQSDEPRTKIPLRKFLFIGPEAPAFATSDQIGRTQRWVGYVTDWVMKRGNL